LERRLTAAGCANVDLSPESTDVTKMSDEARALARRLPSRPLPASPARGRKSGYIAAKAVGAFVPRLTQKAFETYGFSAATLVTDWAAIVGAALARDTAPERLKWPRLPGSGATGADLEVGSQPGAMLILRVDPARALDVEYRRAQILDRINSYFGYRAVAEIRLVQRAVALPSAEPTCVAPQQTAARPSTQAAAMLADVADERLRVALGRLHDGVAARKSATRPA